MNRIVKVVLIFVFLIFAIYVGISLLYPVTYKEYILDSSENYTLDPKLILAVIKTESNFDPQAVSSKGAKGLMQISDSTGIWGSEVLDINDFSINSLYNPEINIKIGAWYLRLLMDQYKDTDTALAAYNGGSGNVSRWLQNPQYSSDGISLENIPFPETKIYVEKVNSNYKYYDLIYGDKLANQDSFIQTQFISPLRSWLLELKRDNR